MKGVKPVFPVCRCVFLYRCHQDTGDQSMVITALFAITVDEPFSGEAKAQGAAEPFDTPEAEKRIELNGIKSEPVICREV